MKTLKAFKNDLGTILINDKGIIESYYPIHLTQPHRNSKTIKHNCWEYNLEWLKPTCKYQKHWYNQIMLAKSKNAIKTYFDSKEPIPPKTINDMIEQTKGLPIRFELLNNYQFTATLQTR